MDFLPFEIKEKLYRLAQLERQFWSRENGYCESEYQERIALSEELSAKFHSLVKLLVEGNVLTVWVDNVMVDPYRVDERLEGSHSINMSGYAVAQDGIEMNDVVRLRNVPPCFDPEVKKA